MLPSNINNIIKILFLTKFIIVSVYRSTRNTIRNIYPPKKYTTMNNNHIEKWKIIPIKGNFFFRTNLSSIFHQVQKIVQCKRGLKNPLEARLEDTMTRFHGSIPIREIRDSFLSRNSRGSGLELVLVGDLGSLGACENHMAMFAQRYNHPSTILPLVIL